MSENAIISIQTRRRATPLASLDTAIAACLSAMVAQIDVEASSLQPLYDLVAQIRPYSSHDGAEIEQRFATLLQTLERQPQLTPILVNYILTLLQQYSPLHFYSDTGIASNEGFFTALTQRLVWRILPRIQSNDQIDGLFNAIFDHKNDAHWLSQIDPTQWARLRHCLSSVKPQPELLHAAQHDLLTALMVVSYRITAMGLESELLRIDPSIDEFESPFMAQNRDVIEFVTSYQTRDQERQAIQEDALTNNNAVQVIASPIKHPDERPTGVMIEQCRDILLRLRKNTRRYGVSIRLTNLMLRIEQSLARMELLFALLLNFRRYELLESASASTNTAANHEPVLAYQNPLLTTLQLLAHDQKHHASISDLISTDIELVALQVTENASKTGGHYVTEDRSGYFAMLRSAMGAGAIIAVMATLKVLLGRAVMAPVIKALTQSMNYSFGFMLIHVLHFTVATKQPAMTAATIAATIHRGSTLSKPVKLSKQAKFSQMADLTRLTINIFRTQFIAILGNISVAMPVGLLIAYLWQTLFHQVLLTHDKAHDLLLSLNPFHSLALFHAAIAGVCLFLSGLIAGYYDNLAVYHHVGARLRQHRTLEKIMSANRLDKISRYIENNLGALAGNFWFGIMLGSMGTIGYILGLPLDIRHIAFASVNFAQGWYALGSEVDLPTVFTSFLGVLLIGLTNLLVSFSLALLVALKAREASFTQWLPLGQLILGHFVTKPTEFFLPPEHIPPASHESSSSQKDSQGVD